MIFGICFAAPLVKTHRRSGPTRFDQVPIVPTREWQHIAEVALKHLARMVIALSLINSTAHAAQRDGPSHLLAKAVAQSNYVTCANRLAFYDRERDATQWPIGKPLPDGYRQSPYAAPDWQQCHLRIPPSGYRWLRSNNDQQMLISSRFIPHIIDQGAYPSDRQLARGKVLPAEYRSPRYAVRDWRDRGLPAPYPGCRWVFINHQFLLVSTSSGLITDVAFDRHAMP